MNIDWVDYFTLLDTAKTYKQALEFYAKGGHISDHGSNKRTYMNRVTLEQHMTIEDGKTAREALKGKE